MNHRQERAGKGLKQSNHEPREADRYRLIQLGMRRGKGISILYFCQASCRVGKRSLFVQSGLMHFWGSPSTMDISREQNERSDAATLKHTWTFSRFHTSLSLSLSKLQHMASIYPSSNIWPSEEFSKIIVLAGEATAGKASTTALSMVRGYQLNRWLSSAAGHRWAEMPR